MKCIKGTGTFERIVICKSSVSDIFLVTNLSCKPSDFSFSWTLGQWVSVGHNWNTILEDGRKINLCKVQYIIIFYRMKQKTMSHHTGIINAHKNFRDIFVDKNYLCIRKRQIFHWVQITSFKPFFCHFMLLLSDE